MTSLEWTIKSASAYTQGGATPASIYATAVTRQGNVHQPGLTTSDRLSILVDGLELPCFVCPADNDTSENGWVRSALLAAHALTGLWNREGPFFKDGSLALSIARSNGTVDAESTIREDTTRTLLVDSLYALGETSLASWCEQAPITFVDKPEDWLTVPRDAPLIWLSADSLINTATVRRLSDRVAAKHFEDGLVLGEAATAVWLNPEPQPGFPRLTVFPTTVPTLTIKEPTLADVRPYTHDLVSHLDQDVDQQAQWSQWLGSFRPTLDLEHPRQTPLNLGFGYVGTAGPGLAVLCALGRQVMPCPPADTLWLFHQGLDRQYGVMKLDLNKDTGVPTPQPKSGVLSG